MQAYETLKTYLVELKGSILLTSDSRRKDRNVQQMTSNSTGNSQHELNSQAWAKTPGIHLETYGVKIAELAVGGEIRPTWKRKQRESGHGGQNSTRRLKNSGQIRTLKWTIKPELCRRSKLIPLSWQLPSHKRWSGHPLCIGLRVVCKRNISAKDKTT